MKIDWLCQDCGREALKATGEQALQNGNVINVACWQVRCVRGRKSGNGVERLWEAEDKQGRDIKMVEIDKEMLERYEKFIQLKAEMDKIYHYKWPVAMYNGVTEWRETTDKLSDILWKLREAWIERPELIEEV